MKMTSIPAARRSLFVLLLGSAILIAATAWPISTALLLAAVVAAALWPLQQLGTRWLRGRRSLSALLLVVAVVIVVGGPLTALSTVAVQRGAEAVRFVSHTLQGAGVAGLIARLPDSIAGVVRDAIERLASLESGGLGARVQGQVSQQGGTAAVAVGSAISATGSFVFQAVMTIIALYCLLHEGDRLVAWLDAVSPLEPGRTRELLQEVRRVSSSVILSSLVTAGVQSVAALVGYLIAGVPYPIFVAGVTFIVAFVPAIGAGSVALAVAALLWASGHAYAALFLAIWALVVVSLIDNVLRPYLIKGDTQMNGAVVFFALIGGIGAFGAVGLLIGPLAVAVFLATLIIYRRDFQG